MTDPTASGRGASGLTAASEVLEQTCGASASAVPDPLQNPSFRPPGLGDFLRGLFLGVQRPLACVQIEVTSRCAGRCVYCPHTTQAALWRSRNMSDTVFAALWPLLRGVERAHLQGWGEPLLHPRFFDFAALALKAGCRVSTTSCGLGMDAPKAAQLAASGLDIVAFSLAGTDAASNDSLRVNVPLAGVARAVRQLQEAQAALPAASRKAQEIHIAYLLAADRSEAVRGLPRLMADWDVSTAVVSTLDFIAAPGQEALAYLPHEREKIARARALLEAAASEAQRDGRVIHYALPGEHPIKGAPGCRENIARTVYVDAEGAMSPCIYVNVPTTEESPRRRILGHALHGDPLRQWREPPFADFRGALLHNVPELPCQDCPKRFEE